MSCCRATVQYASAYENGSSLYIFVLLERFTDECTLTYFVVSEASVGSKRLGEHFWSSICHFFSPGAAQFLLPQRLRALRFPLHTRLSTRTPGPMVVSPGGMRPLPRKLVPSVAVSNMTIGLFFHSRYYLLRRAKLTNTCLYLFAALAQVGVPNIYPLLRSFSVVMLLQYSLAQCANSPGSVATLYYVKICVLFY